MGIGRVVAGGAVVLAGLGVLSACGWDITKEKATDETGITGDVTSVLFDNDAGNVTITTGDAPTVKRVIHYEDEQPDTTHRVENGVLTLAPCPVEDCWIDYEVVVPEGVTVDGSLDSGNAEVTGVDEANVQASSGNVTVRDVTGPVNVEASSGNVELDGIGGTAQVRVNSGNATVALTDPADVRVDADSGDIDVAVPDGTYQVTANADSGEVTSDVTSDDTAEHELHLRADSGDVTVHRA
ncbi:DUF4097 domain-containing protein [Actinophytocola gossypii]|uniref:DUF4097 family beta strand repeat protein n=1 Tax=Actinophytocola gossypii TaxID=2812003 RepID=A0ABT2JFI6_9PSEU|nr:DUF4097 domain-containing protein [Actinophytocola gossypii]MCT2586044.1 DUF4097 family beta strand repeat protein [Actinophytocola gossypii]